MSSRSPPRDISIRSLQQGWLGRFQAMGSPCELLCESRTRSAARQLTNLVAAEAWRVEDKFSRYLSGNVIDRINSAQGEPVLVDDETANLLDFADTLYELSNASFDITSGVMRQVWNFDGSDTLPSQEQVSRVLARVGWRKGRWVRPTLRLPADMEIDLGGLGKEYAVDSAVLILRGHTDTPCLVNFGGDLAVTGPPQQRAAWSVGVEGVAEGRADRMIELRAGALATSGDARRFLLKEGNRYSHILDPRTGWPVADAPNSVTVAADTCTQAGMISTLAMLRGADAEIFLDDQAEQYWCRR